MLRLIFADELGIDVQCLSQRACGLCILLCMKKIQNYRP
jgi:hypothetical protein